MENSTKSKGKSRNSLDRAIRFFKGKMHGLSTGTDSVPPPNVQGPSTPCSDPRDPNTQNPNTPGSSAQDSSPDNLSATCYERYCHTIRMAYRARGADQATVDQSFLDSSLLSNLSAEEIIQAVYPTIKARLQAYCGSLCKDFLRAPLTRQMTFLGRNVVVPILNKQGKEWYFESPMSLYDFVEESALGLHENCQVVYDFGGHHGIWALYYSILVGPGGRVYSFEPSIINVEVSSLLFLANRAANVVNVAAAIGTRASRDESSKMIVDFVSPDSIQVASIRDVCWDKADFLKMDIEGFEYDLITENPWIFDLATHHHIELHIPHLIARNLNYQDVVAKIPFEKFDVFNHKDENRVYADTPLEGFCSLMLRRKKEADK